MYSTTASTQSPAALQVLGRDAHLVPFLGPALEQPPVFGVAAVGAALEVRRRDVHLDLWSEELQQTVEVALAIALIGKPANLLGCSVHWHIHRPALWRVGSRSCVLALRRSAGGAVVRSGGRHPKGKRPADRGRALREALQQGFLTPLVPPGERRDTGIYSNRPASQVRMGHESGLALHFLHMLRELPPQMPLVRPPSTGMLTPHT